METWMHCLPMLGSQVLMRRISARIIGADGGRCVGTTEQLEWLVDGCIGGGDGMHNCLRILFASPPRSFLAVGAPRWEGNVDRIRIIIMMSTTKLVYSC